MRIADPTVIQNAERVCDGDAPFFLCVHKNTSYLDFGGPSLILFFIEPELFLMV